MGDIFSLRHHFHLTFQQMPKQTISLNKLNNLNNWYYDNNNITITKIPVLNEIESLKNKDIITKITISIIVPTQVDGGAA